MISKSLLKKINTDEFLIEAQYFGMAIAAGKTPQIKDYLDLETFFLKATYHLTSSRIAEGFLCWLLKYGHLLSPSKIRRLIKLNTPHDPEVLGGLVAFLIKNKIDSAQWTIVKTYSKKSPYPRPLLKGPLPRKPNPEFLKYNLILHDFDLDQDKFLQPMEAVLKKCLTLKNRALFGSCVNADVATYLSFHPAARPYEISKETANYKARVFAIHTDVKLGLGI